MNEETYIEECVFEDEFEDAENWEEAINAVSTAAEKAEEQVVEKLARFKLKTAESYIRRPAVQCITNRSGCGHGNGGDRTGTAPEGPPDNPNKNGAADDGLQCTGGVESTTIKRHSTARQRGQHADVHLLP